MLPRKHVIQLQQVPKPRTDFRPVVPTSHLKYDEYTGHTLAVERRDGEEEDWPPALICRG